MTLNALKFSEILSGSRTESLLSCLLALNGSAVVCFCGLSHLQTSLRPLLANALLFCKMSKNKNKEVQKF